MGTDKENIGCEYFFTRFYLFDPLFVRPEKCQFLEKGKNRNFGYEIVISVKNPEFIL